MLALSVIGCQRLFGSAFGTIVDETRGWGKKPACHAYRGIGLHRAGGCDSIEHGLDLDDAAIAQMLKPGQ